MSLPPGRKRPRSVMQVQLAPDVSRFLLRTGPTLGGMITTQHGTPSTVGPTLRKALSQDAELVDGQAEEGDGGERPLTEPPTEQHQDTAHESYGSQDEMDI